MAATEKNIEEGWLRWRWRNMDVHCTSMRNGIREGPRTRASAASCATRAHVRGVNDGAAASVVGDLARRPRAHGGAALVREGDGLLPPVGALAPAPLPPAAPVLLERPGLDPARPTLQLEHGHPRFNFVSSSKLHESE